MWGAGWFMGPAWMDVRGDAWALGMHKLGRCTDCLMSRGWPRSWTGVDGPADGWMGGKGQAGWWMDWTMGRGMASFMDGEWMDRLMDGAVGRLVQGWGDRMVYGWW